MSWYSEVPCSTAMQFIEAIDKIRSNSMIYRGLGDSDFKLRPTLYRKRYGGLPFEIDVVNRFMLASQRAGLVIPPDAMTFVALWAESKRDNLTMHLAHYEGHENVYKYDVGNIAFAMARHAEIPTRHLDFSWEPLVATYFAVSDAIQAYEDSTKNTPEKIAVWALDYPAVRGSFGTILHDWTHIPSLRNQQGLFLFDPTINVDSLNCWTEAPSFEERLSRIPFGNKNRRITLTVTNENLQELADYLARRNITKWTILPTYENVRDAVMFRYENPSST